MVDTLDNVDIPANTFVDIYDATGISVGVQIDVQNLADGDLYLTTKATLPTATDAYQLLLTGQIARNDLADSGAWVYSPNRDGKINVKVV